ncbi:hypothetical protein VC83_02250 [Pseudogymnoascus destructans]|uniref:JmjC domain-containing protein n=2 Tax=Pseudogymnoascus destructans TaxID=655981 RepID=L8G9D1_PSED2|nr:uncharacterized protein VC83_02250 [Pseudogymnoascus destructans]ELR08621.1 hypothetical protein GMDG_03312 [Pseudogymnoascus destructans 20631-21]OAF61590.1 hypothetical protein VC83_02250 [Pseudogymnoascus destructans]
MEQTFAEALKPAEMSSADGLQALDFSQLPECAPTRSQAEMEEYMGCLQTEGVHKTPTELPDIKMESPQDAASLPRPQQQSLNDECPAQTQQARLFNDPRRHKLFEEYNEVIRQNPDSHLARLGELAHYVFDNGRPARVWTAGGVGSAHVGLDPSTTSIHGRCSCTYDEADILLLTESEHAAWSRANNPPKLVVIRDPEFSRRRPAKSTESWLREQEKRTNKKWVDVQRLNRQCNDGAAENIPLQDAIQQWRTSQNSDVISLETPPMNLLNISDKTVGHWPEGLAKDYQLLFEAIDECEGMIYRSLDERLVPLSEQDRGIGKTTLMLFSHSDIQKCTQFRILAHRGACSSWHIDNAGVYTFIVLEGNIDSPDEKAEDVVKYWPVYPTHHMNAQDEDAARLGFSKEGINWRPKPDGKIPVIALTRGDMLIQPPGTIHAPITLTNCFFLGGMAWRRNTLPQTLNVWHYLMKNDICTNEPLPRQSQAILDFIKVAVHDAPEEHGYRQDELGDFDKICDEISGMVSRCSCSKACSLSTKCSCLMQGLKCGIRCHKGSTLHHTTCTTVNMLPPSSLSGRKRYAKRSRLRDDEDSDYTSNGTPAAKSKRKKRAIEALQAKAPIATLDAISLLPHEHLNNSPTVAGSDYTPNGTPSGKPKGKSAVEALEGKALEAIAQLLNASANNSPAGAVLVESKRPEICSGSSTGGTCEYDAQVRSNRLVCKRCGTVVELGGDAIRHTRPRANTKAGVVNGIDSPSTGEAVSQKRKCHECQRSTITVDRRGPDGPNTLCGRCAKRRAKAKPDQEANKEAATPATLLPSIEMGVSSQKMCDNCHKTDIIVDRRGPNGTGTLCWTCGRKYSKENAQKEANNKGEAPAFDEANATSGTYMGGNRNTLSRSSKSQTPEASKRQPRPLKEGYCLQCKAAKSTSWHGYEDSTGKGKRCGGCYQHAYDETRKERKRSLVGNATNKAIVRKGIKSRISSAASSTAKEQNADKMDASQQDPPPVQFQTGILPPLFNTPPSLPQENTIIHARKTNLSITAELPIAAEPQELAQHELAGAYPLQYADPQVLIDLQSFQSHEATPEPSVEHKLEANGFMVSKPEPQTFPAFTQDDAVSSKYLNPDTKPEAAADVPTTNGSTTTESSTEHSNSHTSSPLTALDDGFSDRENADLFIPR